MKIIKTKEFAAIITTFLLLIVLTFNSGTSYASTLNMPEITKFTNVEKESNALKLEFKSNNTGTDFSYEIANTTAKRVNIVSGSLKSFVMQNLDNNKEYEVMIRLCKKESYSCTPWTNLVKAVTKNITSNISTPSKTTTPATNNTTTKKTTKKKVVKPTCSLTYNSKNDKLTFKSTKNAVKYSIVKSGKKAKYTSKKPTHHPGSDRMNSKSNYVKIKYIGYVKSKKGIVGKCNYTVKVSRGAAAASYAKEFLGIKYVHYKRWDGEKPLKGTDCSGFTAGIYRHLGRRISGNDDVQCRTSYERTYKVAGQNSTKGAKAGDIVCYRRGSDNIHVSIYLGDGKMIEMTSAGKGQVRIYEMNKKPWYKIIRVK